MSVESCKEASSYKGALDSLIDLTEGEGFYKEKIENGYCIFGKTLDSALGDYSYSFSCPQSIRLEILAQHDYRVLVVTKTAFSPTQGNSLGIISFPTTLIARVFRIVFKFLAAPWFLLKGAIDEHRIKQPGIIKEMGRNFGYELVDFFFTLASLPIGIVNLCSPNCIKLDWFRNHYVNQLDHTKEFEVLYNQADTNYRNELEALEKKHEEFKTKYQELAVVKVQHVVKKDQYQLVPQE